MPSKLRPLWRCPKCRKTYVTRNIWHSCRNYDLKSLFAGSEPHVFKIYKKFERMVRECGPITINPQSQRIAFQVRVRFGGAIEVEANDPADTASRNQIRKHLEHIAQMFSEGDFSAPMFIHDQMPPGVPAMRELKSLISYRCQSTERGGRVVISTSDPRARAAVHEFLRFQIRDHQTGDPLEVQRQP